MSTSEEQFHEELVAMVSQTAWEDPSSASADVVMPAPRSNHTTCFYENSVVLFGGHGGLGYQRKAFQDCWILNLDNARWQELTCAGNPPAARSGHQAFIKDGSIYIFGGWNTETQFNDLFQLDIENKDWSDVDLAWGVPRWNCCLQLVVAIPSWRVFVFGGTADTEGAGRVGGLFDNVIGVLNLADGAFQWDEPKLEMTPDQPLPAPREHSAISYDFVESRLIIFGGWANKWLPDVWQINVSSIVGPPYAITQIVPALGPVTGMMSVRVEGIGFKSTAGQVNVQFSCGDQFAETQGEAVTDEIIEAKTPSVVGGIGQKKLSCVSKLDRATSRRPSASTPSS